ncbi:hypothetical protein E2C01_100443 [Portunus trituberculatus]|uniref:Uncharacterized protein n=1 Tax=Portunus trituberculatus TaxID=210409 RepID=A0A5B7KHK5_PORTR|nr:hypothetical protein [Portunus trituberculatus]
MDLTQRPEVLAGKRLSSPHPRCCFANKAQFFVWLEIRISQRYVCLQHSIIPSLCLFKEELYSQEKYFSCPDLPQRLHLCSCRVQST